jgi:hypothetical protein
MTASNRSSGRSSFFSISRFLALCAFHALTIALASAQATYCAFEVKVSAPSGSPVSKVPVVLVVKHTTSFAETTTDENGVARLCDAPLEPVDIAVGSDICGLVLVRNMHDTWPESRKVYVTYVDAPCDHFGVAPNCLILLRIQDDDGRRISGARFEPKSQIGSGSNVSDSFGRIFQFFKKRERLEGIVIKSGYSPVPISELCLDNQEVKVVLRKQP